MKTVTSEQMREMDRRAIAEFGASGMDLMERAGRGVAQAVAGLARASGCRGPILLLAGHGNNGGDAFVAARHLKALGFDITLQVVGDEASIKGDAGEHLRLMQAAGVTLDPFAVASPVEGGASGIVVDGLLGTGSAGAAREPLAGAIRHINALGARHLVVAIDIPSGLNADTGETPGDVVRADLTVTMGLPKQGLLEPRAADYVGSLTVVDIGLPPALVAALQSDIELLTPAELSALRPRRERATHKGTYGHVLLIGGSRGYTGAMTLAARAALRSGAGLVSALVPAGIAPIVAAGAPEAMVHPAAETPAGTLAVDCLAKWNHKLAEFDAVLVGPGLSMQEPSPTLVDRILIENRCPLVLDADALSSPNRLVRIRNANSPVILTPHPGEMARLTGRRPADIQAARFAAAREAAEKSGSVVVLKGAGTLVAGKSAPLYVNMTGNPGMATGGMGDVLSGLLAGLLAQGVAPLDAARLAVYLHGSAGDLAAWRLSQAALTAGDIIETLPAAFKELWPR